MIIRLNWLGWALASALLMVASISASAQNAAAAELVVFDAKDCVISQRFHREALASYSATKGSRVFPLRRVDISDGDAGILLEQEVTQTPTFVFVDKGQEIARVTGYPGRELLYRIVDEAADAFLESKPSF